jgi:hypothetical protein
MLLLALPQTDLEAGRSGGLIIVNRFNFDLSKLFPSVLRLRERKFLIECLLREFVSIGQTNQLTLCRKIIAVIIRIMRKTQYKL